MRQVLDIILPLKGTNLKLIDFNLNIYDKIVELKFIRYLRDEYKFETIDLLKKQMHKDIMQVKAY